MTIKDMELQTGLARANIRYYEAEGLITPERAENGYRDYSQEDAETLLRVKLLRALGLTVGQIKAVVRGETELDAALSARIAAIQKEKTALDRAGEIAGRIRQAHAQFRTLDARPYLDEMQTERVLERDTLPKEHFPWQRFFARLHIIAVREPERGDPLRCGVRFSGVGTQRGRVAHASAPSGSTT